MTLKVLSLSDLLSGTKQEIKEKIPEVQNILNTFESISITGSKSAHDVDNFLKNKAIEFDRQRLAGTHLVFSQYKSKLVLVGYFTITNKPLVFTKRMLSKCSNTLKRKLYQKGETHSGNDNLIIQGYLIAQIGKNYSQEALATKAINGRDLLTLAYEMILDGANVFGGSYIWIEYEDVDRLKDFYKRFGFTEIEDYTSENELKMAILKL
ncbi:hypothetical protein QI091_10390 [Staphylococcus saprophyticus]|uniref:hypothetical protein n=1 Tax=Staphylococcus saprophyticus TaxID=29385 RepID=UPI00197E92C2|nr:hypothetical protein [Staphylococcus saprophyticus]MDW4255969.1 hypothetical protein [Staphylococcus saprophyticus]